MKRIFRNSLVVIALISCTFFSCNKTEIATPTSKSKSQISSPLKSSDLRYSLIESGVHLSTLTNEEILEVIISKLEQILDTEIPAEEHYLIELLTVEITKHLQGEESETVAIAAELANLIPEDDFVLMFMELEDYHYNGSYIGEEAVSVEIIDEILGLRFRTEYEKEPKLLICDCSWMTCPGGSTKCAERASGCGVFWLYPCTQIGLIDMASPMN